MAKRFFDSWISRLFLVAAFMASTLTGVAMAPAFEDRVEALRKEGSDFTLVLDEKTAVRDSKAVALTFRNNEILFAVEGFSTLAGGFGRIGAKGSVSNQTPLSGLRRLSIAFKDGETETLSLSYGWDDEVGYASGIALSASTPSTDFGAGGPAFFRLENQFSAAVDIRKITLFYSCLASPLPRFKSGGVAYVLSSNSASYSAASFDGTASAISFDSAIRGIPVSSIGDNFMNGFGSRVSSLTLPSSITVLGKRALYGSAASSIDISNIVSFGECALSNCGRLTSVSLCSSLVSLPDYGFNNCVKLESIFISLSVVSMGHYVFNSCPSLAIRCQALSQPSGWDSGWNPSRRPVIWGASA